MSDQDRISQAARTFADRVQASLSAEIEAFAAEVSRAVAEERASTAERTAGELLAARADVERALHEEVARLRDEADRAAQEASGRAAGELAAARDEAERRLQEEVARVREEADRAVREAASRAADEIATARAEAEQRVKEEAARVREHDDQALREAATAARAQAETLFQVERARLLAETDQDTRYQVTAALARERQSQMQIIEQVAGAVRQLDQARSLTEVLSALLDGAAAQAPRVAVLTLHGQRIRSWRLTGFGPDVPPVDLAVEDSGVVARALEQLDIAFAEPASPDHPIPPGPGFTALPDDRSGIAIPIVVGGAPVAVLYVDDVSDSEQAKPASWPEAVEILARHAAVRLENLTAVRAAQALGVSGPGEVEPAARRPAGQDQAPRVEDPEEGEARRYARLLITELKFYNEAAVRVGREQGDLLRRLRNDIERARRLYDERVPAAIGSKWVVFDEELVQTLAGGDPSRLGPRTDALA